MLDRRSGLPLYTQLAEHLRGRINTREFPPGGYLPSEGNLAATYQTTRDVVRDAMLILRNEGLVDCSRGYRSLVRRPPVHEPRPAPPDARITARMPTLTERREYTIPEGVPLLIVRTGDTETLYPAHQVALITPPDPIEFVNVQR